MYLYDRNMLTNTNLRYANSSVNYYVIMMLQNLEKISIFFALPSHEVPSLSNQQPQSGCCLRETRREAT